MKNEQIETTHVPVLLKEVLEALPPKDGGIYFDGTFGGGGYTRAILESCNCKVIASDRDPFVKDIAARFSEEFGERFVFVPSKFSDIDNILKNLNIKKTKNIVYFLVIITTLFTEKTSDYIIETARSLADLAFGFKNISLSDGMIGFLFINTNLFLSSVETKSLKKNLTIRSSRE